VLSLDTWLLFCLACVALVATPGPSIVYLVSRTLAQGRPAGFVSLCGTSTGFAVHALAAAFGLSALLAAVPLAYDAVRWLGAAYLVYLGLRTLLTRADEPTAVPVLRSHGARRAFGEGVVVEALNVKTAVFFLAFLPQFVDVALPLVPQFVVLGSICVMLNTAVDVAVVLGASVALARWHRRVRLRAWLQRVSGATMLALGIGMALLRHER